MTWHERAGALRAIAQSCKEDDEEEEQQESASYQAKTELKGHQPIALAHRSVTLEINSAQLFNTSLSPHFHSLRS